MAFKETLTPLLGDNAISYEPKYETTTEFMNGKFKELLDNDLALREQINVLKPVRNIEPIEYYNSWSAWAGAYGIKLDKIGSRVFCSGVLAVGVKDNGTIIFTVPDGFRPIALEPRFLKGDDGKNHHIDISSNGQVVVDTSANTGWSTSSVVLIDFECNWEV